MKEGKDKFCEMTQTFVSVAAGARRNIVKNERNDSYWIPKQMYCPNCGTLSVGYQREGLTEFECGRCLTMFVRSYKNRRQDCVRNRSIPVCSKPDKPQYFHPPLLVSLFNTGYSRLLQNERKQSEESAVLYAQRTEKKS